jgi:hypothetical protein
MLSYLCVWFVGQVSSTVDLLGLDAHLRRLFLSNIWTNS